MVALSEVAGIVAGIISFAAYPIYIFRSWQKDNSPHPFTWILSAIISFVFLFSYRESGAGNTFWVPLSDFIGNTILAIFVLAQAEHKKSGKNKQCSLMEWLRILSSLLFQAPTCKFLKWFMAFDIIDRFCAILTVIAILFLSLSNDAYIAFAATLLAEVLALIPTIRSVWQDHNNEDALTWGFSVLGDVFNIFAIQKGVLVEIIYVTVTLVANGIVFVIAFLGNLLRKAEKAFRRDQT